MKEGLKNNSLGNVAGGRVVETKNGEWLVVPDFCRSFSTKEEAEAFDAEMREDQIDKNGASAG